MADYQEFRKKSRRRRMKKRALSGAVVAVAIGILVGGGYLALSGLGFLEKAPVSSSIPAQETAEPEQLTVPQDNAVFKVTPVAENQDWNTSAYDVKTLDYTVLGQDDGTTAMDFRLLAQPACGRVDRGYYDHVTFMGDSLTQGLELYTTGLPNASYCAYKGIGPNAVVNGTVGTRTNGSKGVPMEDLALMAPDAIYVLFGTNVLTNASDTAQQSFMAYYEQMLDMIMAARPGIHIYMQSITPVRPAVSAEKPGLNSQRLQRINDELAALAVRKGCSFIDLWEPLADTEGNLREDYAAGDGIHMNPTGYAAWVEYLRTHTKYTPGALYEAGSGSYYIDA